MLPVKLERDRIEIGKLGIVFHRTLRLPDDGNTYPLPASLGQFPIHRVEDYARAVPQSWLEHGGVFLPMYQREAMWMSFAGQHWRPQALKVAVGMVNAVSGEPWQQEIREGAKQDYLVCPPQPWLDGINAGSDMIRQFVAMPLGMGYTVEGQVTGEERFGGVQLVSFDPRPGMFPERPFELDRRFRVEQYPLWIRKEIGSYWSSCRNYPEQVALAQRAGVDVHEAYNIARLVLPNGEIRPPVSPRGVLRGGLIRARSAGHGPMMKMARAGGNMARLGSAEMGLAAGGKMHQKIYDDPYGVHTWDSSNYGRVYVHIVNSEMYKEITGRPAPDSPVTADAYRRRGIPWFDLYDEHYRDVEASDVLAGVKTVQEMDEQHGFTGLQDDTPIDIGPHSLITKPVAPVRLPGQVSDGDWTR